MAKYISIRGGAAALLENQVAHLSHDLILQSGVLDIVGNHWKVTEHNPQNMTIDIAAGRGYFKKVSMTYHGFTDATENPAIAANNSGNPRIDAVVFYVDLGASPNADASNVLKTMVVQGTAAPSPVAPTDNEIQSAVGAGNPFVRIANIAVGNGVSTIVNGNITDARLPCYMKIMSGIKDTELINPTISGAKNSVKAYSGNGTITLDCANYNVFEVTMAGDVTLAVSGMQIGQFIQIDAIQDATGSRALAWFSGIAWLSNVVPPQTPTATKRNSYVIKKVGANSYIGYLAGDDI